MALLFVVMMKIQNKLPKELHYQVLKLIVLVAVLPYGSAKAERNFSGLKIIKSRLRSTMGDGWLDDLLCLFTEKDLLNKALRSDEEMEKVIDIFRDMKTRLNHWSQH